MYLRGKATDNVRTFLADSPNGMRRPLKVDEDMYAETHYGVESLLHILHRRILEPVGFDCSNIHIVIRKQGVHISKVKRDKGNE
jgi:hypothetical protein